MPRISVSDRLSAAMTHFNVSVDMQRKLINAVFSPHSSYNATLKKSARVENTWKTLTDDVRAVLRGLASNRYKQHDDMRELYDQYIGMVRTARDDIVAASGVMIKDRTNPDGPKIPATLDDIRRLAANRNRKLGIDGPTCTSRWHTWIAPADRAAMRTAFEIAYAKAQRGAGKRVTPFLTSDVVQYNKTRMETLRGFIADQRAAMTAYRPDDHEHRQPMSNIPHHALHLCALRMAERALDDWAKSLAKDKYHGLDNPLPVQWTHLLDATMRERVRSVDENPSAVTLIGLEQFYWDDGSARALIIETEEQRAANIAASGWD